MNEVRKRIDDSNQFILYKVEPRANAQGETKQSKVPKTYKGSAADYTGNIFIYDADKTSPAAWKPFHDAYDAYERSAADGVGIALTDDLGITCCDFDHCLDDEGNLIDGNPTADAAKEALFMFGNSAFWEVSQSGYGLHCYVLGLIPKNIPPGHTVEMYCRGAYMAMTFTPYKDAPAEAGMENALQLFYDKYKPVEKSKPTPGTKTKTILSADDGQNKALSDQQIIEHLKPQFRQLFEEGYENTKYVSQSEADMALLGEIAFYADANPETIDRVFRQSALYREKWERDDYSTNSINKVLEGLKDTYSSFIARRREEGLKALTAMTAAGIQDIDIFKMVCEYDPAYRDGFENDTISLGEMFAHLFDNLVRFNTDTDHFYKYSGGVWSADAGDIVTKELMRRMQRSLLRYAKVLDDPENRKFYTDYFKGLASINKRDQVLKDSRGSANTVSYSMFDQQSNFLNCKNGTLNLDTGEFKEHDPNDLLSKTVACAYDPNASTAAMDEFVLNLMSGDQELAWYLQRSIGLCAVGEARKDCFWILIGPPRTGKTTLCNVIRRVMNTYAVSVKPDFLAQSNYKTQNDEELAKLRGARLAVSEELSQNMILDAAKIKQLTGRAEMQASRKYEHTVDFTPVCKIFIATNHYPTVSDPTLNKSNRIKVVEFCNVIPPEEINDHLEDELLANSAGVLNWILEGYYSFKEEGLEEPAAVKESIHKFEQKGDKFSHFLEDCLEDDPDGKCVPISEVYPVYRDWCKRYQYEAELPGQFSQIIKDRGLFCKSGTTRKGTKHNVIKGMRIIQFTEVAEEE